MRDIILYYYDHSDEMEFLNDIQEKIARKNKTTETKVKVLSAGYTDAPAQDWIWVTGNGI